MVVAHFNFVGVVVIAPDKADTVLIVDPYAVLSFPVTFERFKAIAGRKSEVVQNLGRIHHFELATGSSVRIPGNASQGSRLKRRSVSLSRKVLIML